MIEYAGAIFLVIGFIFILKIFGVVDKSSRVIEISKCAIADLRCAELDDEAKESAMQVHAKHLFQLFFIITIGCIAAIILPLAVIWGLDRMHLVSIDGVLNTALSWPFLIATTALISIALVFTRAR